MSRKSVLQESQGMLSKKCLTRVPHKSVKQECLTRALRNSVKQGCPTKVSPQCVNSGCLTSEFVGNVTNKYSLCLSTYVSAFGFVGFILFLCLLEQTAEQQLVRLVWMPWATRAKPLLQNVWRVCRRPGPQCF